MTRIVTDWINSWEYSQLAGAKLGGLATNFEKLGSGLKIEIGVRLALLHYKLGSELGSGLRYCIIKKRVLN